jgi:hypothetical protein
MKRDQKITFGEMRRSGVRSIMIYCADYRRAHSTTALAVAGPTMSGCPISKTASSAKRAGGGVLTSGRCSGRLQWGPITAFNRPEKPLREFPWCSFDGGDLSR